MKKYVIFLFIFGVPFTMIRGQTSQCPLPKDFTLCQCNGLIQLTPSETSESPVVTQTESAVQLVVCQYVTLTKILSEFRKSQIPPESIPALTITYADMEFLKGEPFEGMKLRALHMNNNKIRNITQDSLSALAPTLILLDLRINRLRSVPALALSTLSELKTLDLAYNSIGRLNAGDFNGLKSLARLHLESNEITTVTAGAFIGLQNSLLELELQNNQIKRIPADVFSNLGALKKLDLARNLIEMLEPNAFSGLESLESLNLGHNHIKAIEGRAFLGLDKVLRVLFLHNNQIEMVSRDNFKHLSSIEYLVLGANSISRLPANCFLDMSSLRTLNLENNKIVDIHDDAFKGLNNSLTYLHLPGNLLSAIPKTALQGLKNLWVLNLGENVIRDVSVDDFSDSNLKNALGTLYLNGNLLVKIPGKALSGFQTLWLLDLGDNEVVSIKNVSFPQLPALEVINLEGNNIKKIELSAFAGLEKSVKKIKLGRNALTSLAVDPFVGLENLRSIDLEGNKIIGIGAEDTEALNKLRGQVRTLALSGNKIEYITPDSFIDLEPYLTAIDLSENKLKTLKTSTFVNSGSVSDINLSKNQLENIEKDTFVEMMNMKTLNVSYNQLQELHPHMFKGLQRLISLDLSYNMIAALPSLAFKFISDLEYLDLSNNNLTYVSGHALAGLSRMKDFRISNNKLLTLEYGTFNRFTYNTLQNIDMRNNPWICDCRLRWLREWMAELMSFKGRSSQTTMAINLNLQNVVCYGPHHLMNSCLLCVPTEAYVCPDPEKYSGLILLPGPRARKLGGRGEQFSWLTRLRRERWTRSLIIILATLLALCLAIILAMSILICKSRVRKHNTRTLSRKNRANEGDENSKMHDSGSKAKLLNTTDSINLGTSDIRGIGLTEVGGKNHRKVSLTSDVDLDYIDTLPQRPGRSSKYGMVESEAGSSNEFLKSLELGCIPRTQSIKGKEVVEEKSPLYENITQSSLNNSEAPAVSHQYSVPNLAASSSIQFLASRCKRGEEEIQRSKIMLRNNICQSPHYHPQYKQYAIVSQEEPDLNGIISNGDPIHLISNLDEEKYQTSRPHSETPLRDTIKILNNNERGLYYKEATSISNTIFKEHFKIQNLLGHVSTPTKSAPTGVEFTQVVYPELYPIPTYMDPIALIDINNNNIEKISV